MVFKRSLHIAGLAIVALAALAGVAGAQQPSSTQPSLLAFVLATAAVIVIHLVLGGIVVLFAPHYLRRTTDRVRNNPGSTFGWGFLTCIGLGVASLLILTLIVTVPVVLLLSVVGFVIASTTVGMVVAGDQFGDSLFKPLAVGVVLLTVVAAIPAIGQLVTFILGMMGAGAMVNEFRDGR